MRAPGRDHREVAPVSRACAGFEEELVRLQNVVAAHPTEELRRWAVQARGELDRLREAFLVHVEKTEGPGGFLDEVVNAAPRLRRRAERLREEHAAIAADIADALSSLDVHIAGSREVLASLSTRLSHHVSKGTDLLWDAFEVDLGGEG